MMREDAQDPHGPLLSQDAPGPAANAAAAKVTAKVTAMAAATLAILSAFLIGCYQTKPGDVAGGGGVETTGGAIASISGSLTGARVRLIPASYDPLGAGAFPDSLETRTREDGTFLFRGVAPGTYNLDVWQPGDGTRAFRTGITVTKDVSSTLPVDTLREPCRARLHLEGVHRGFIFQTGTANKRKLEYVEADSATLVLDSLPVGTLPPISLADSVAVSGPSPSVPLTDSLKTVAGGLIEPAAYTSWAHQGTWSIDTSGAGEAWIRSAGDYPVAVRLSNPGFDFTQAMANGEDLRFADADGNALPYAIERWDAGAGKAAVWVNLKRAGIRAVGGAFRMYWGKTGAIAMGRSEAVFDTALGFTCVWHLSETGNNKKNGYADATATQLGGWGTEMVADDPESGLVAGAQIFDGKSRNIRMDNAPLAWKGAFAASAWIEPGFGSGDDMDRVILARWEENQSSGFVLQYSPGVKGLRLILGMASPARIFTLDAPNLAFNQGDWHHVAATFDGKTASLYWDGSLLAQQSPGSAAIADNFRDLLIGAKGDPDPNLAETQFFLGRIDEVRILRTVNNPDWIQMDYRTQRPGSTALHMEGNR